MLDMSAEQIDAWQNYLAETGKKLLIEQVWEPVAAIRDVETYAGVILSKEDRNEFKRVLRRKATPSRAKTTIANSTIVPTAMYSAIRVQCMWDNL